MEKEEDVKTLNLHFSQSEYIFLSKIKEELKKIKGKKISWEDVVIELAKKYNDNKEKDIIMELELEAGQFLKKLSLVNVSEDKIEKLKDLIFAIIENNTEWEKKALEELCNAK